MRKAVFDSRQLGALKRACKSNQNFLISDRVGQSLHVVRPIETRRRAAVLIPLCNRHGEASILFTLRTQQVNTHKGQVSFVGGHLESGETAPEAAIRETYEEIGFPKERIEIIGQGQTIPAITNTLVTPILGFLHGDLGDFEQLRLNSNEVDQIFTRTLEELLDPERNCYETLSRDGQSGSFPVFGTQDKQLRIWGLTAIILRATLDRVIVPNLI